MQISKFQAAEDDMIKQKQKLEHEVQELHSHIQVENTNGCQKSANQISGWRLRGRKERSRSLWSKAEVGFLLIHLLASTDSTEGSLPCPFPHS